MTMRLAPQPGEEIDRGHTFTFSWNGRAVSAFPGDTLASALAAAGERVLSRSYKYHRPRGLLTASYHDPGCFFQVGDEPNVRGAHRLAEPGMDVHSQDTWPSLRFDVRSEVMPPLPSANVQYPARPVSFPFSWEFMADWISDCVRLVFHNRTSASMPGMK